MTVTVLSGLIDLRMCTLLSVGRNSYSPCGRGCRGGKTVTTTHCYTRSVLHVLQINLNEMGFVF